MTDPKNDFEQQLHAIHPRAPQVDWNLILPAAPKPMIAMGFSTWQMTSAVFASWIVGAIVGGSVIFWSMGKQSLSPDPSNEPSTLVQQSKEPSAERQPYRQQLASQSPAVGKPGEHPGLADASIDWLDQDVLSVRSHALSGTRVKLTASKNSGDKARRDESQKNFTDQVIADVDSQRPVVTPESAPVSNRQQLLKQYLDDTQTIY